MNSRSEAPLKTQAKAQEGRKTAAAVLGVLASGICAVGAAPPVQNLAAQMADDSPRPRVALTFDDGPHPIYTKRLLDGLQSRGIRATFFVVGENISGSEELIRRMAGEGHVIGNHTYSHIKLSGITDAEALSLIHIWKRLLISLDIRRSRKSICSTPCFIRKTA